MYTTSIFSKNIRAYRQKHNLIVDQGSQGSSKTISILQLIYFIVKDKKKHAAICSYALPHLKGGALKDWENILQERGINVPLIRNKTENTYRINESKVEFFGIEGNEARAYSFRPDILFVNEANRKIKWEVFLPFFSRVQDCTFIDFNPSSEFWYHDQIQQNFKHAFIHSTFNDNPYLSESERQNILDKKDKPGFENWWRVYGLGELGKLEGAILQNWKYGDFNDLLPYGYGLDFGSKHPDAMVKVAVDRKNKKIYLKEEIYQSGLSTNQLTDIIKKREVGNKMIVAESAAPRTILDLKTKDFNIRPVHKGEIIDDIKLLWDYELIVDPESYNLAKELNNWLWLDKKGEIPMDEFDHLIDATRYYARTILKPYIQKGQKLLK